MGERLNELEAGRDEATHPITLLEHHPRPALDGHRAALPSRLALCLHALVPRSEHLTRRRDTAVFLHFLERPAPHERAAGHPVFPGHIDAAIPEPRLKLRAQCARCRPTTHHDR